MLKHLLIENYALIQHLDIDLHQGFSVITGETGAGKSIILGALGLILGGRADSKVVKAGAKRCIVEATFDISQLQLSDFFTDNDIDYDEECIIRRELTETGKNRNFINDTPVSLSILKALSQYLIDIHSQHQNFLLGNETFQLEILDSASNNQSLKNDYIQAYQSFHEAEKKLAEFSNSITQQKMQKDFLMFQLQELKDAQLNNEDEQQELEEEATILNNAEEIKQGLFEADNFLSAESKGILSKLRNCTNALQGILDVYPTLQSTCERLESVYIELKDIASDLSDETENIDFDPRRQEFINERLSLFYTLEKKHNQKDLPHLINYYNKLKQQIGEIENSDSLLEDMQKECERLNREVLRLGGKLTQSRKESISTVTEGIKKHLLDMGMPNVRFEIQLTPLSSPSIHGLDNVAYLFSANSGSPLQNIAQIASGGEIARTMLALKAVLSSLSPHLSTLIFDEIDTGVSGRMAEKMAVIMKEIASSRQVISITHLPQIAALGDHHYKVYKEDYKTQTTTHVCLLERNDRITEIAHMLSGSLLTEAAINNAKVLLKEQ